MGLVTSSSFAAPRPLTIPFVSVVFPAPRSPESKISAGGLICAPISRPRSMVSSEECVTSSRLSHGPHSAIKLLIGAGTNRIRSRRHQRRLARIRIRHVARKPVQIDAEAQHASPLPHAVLRREAREDSGEDVPRAAGAHARISGGIDPRLAVRRGDDGLMALQNHDSIPIGSRLSGNFDAPRLNFGTVQATRRAISPGCGVTARFPCAYLSTPRRGPQKHSIRPHPARSAPSDCRQRGGRTPTVSLCVESPGPMPSARLPFSSVANDRTPGPQRNAAGFGWRVEARS